MVTPVDNVHWHVELKGVQKTYDGETLVVKGVDLRVAPGEFLTLLGPSGSGKTTILMMLAGFETPTAGEILLDGQAIAGLPPHQRDIGVVFQDYALFPHLTVAENIGFPLQVRKHSPADIARKVEDMLAMVQLEGLGQRRPHQLSGGQKQRVALARALVFSPKLVLMDEPLGALDKQLREHMQLEIKRLHAMLGLTVIYVTHDQSEALTMSHRVAVFHEGRIRQNAPPRDIYRYPTDPFVAGFIGENNLFTGRVTALEGRCASIDVDDVGIVAGSAVASYEIGEMVTLAIRPEEVVLGEGVEACKNQYRGIVTECIYHGDHTRVRVRLGAEQWVVAKVPGAPTELGPDTPIAVGWHEAPCRVLAPRETDSKPGETP